MAQLVVSAAGAAAGFAIGGVQGAQIGWTLGSVIGASFAPAQKQRGPRLEDLKVSGTEYGQPIAYLVGHPRVAGQVWWASDKREIATTTEAGKGGPSVETTTYTYEVDLLLGLSSNQIMGVSRVWSNGKLVWTKRSDSGTTSALSGKSQTSWRRISVYQGRSDQLPDPTYEAAVGVGNAPAYRGRGTVFLEGVQLGSSGQIPNFTFEVYTEGDEQGRTATTLDTFPYTTGQNGGIPGMSLPSFTQHMRYGVSRIDVYRFTLGLEETEFVGSYTPVVDGFNALWASSDVSGSFLINVGSTTAYWYNDEGAGTLFTLPYNINVGSLLTVFCRRDDVVLIGDWNSGGNKRIYKYSTAGGTHSVMGAALPAQALSITISGDQVYVLEAKGTLAPTAIWELDLATLSLQATLSVPSGMSQYAALMTDDLGTVYCYTGSNDLYRLEGGSTWVLAKNFTGGIAYGQTGTRYSINGGDLWAVAVPGGGNPARIRVVFDSVTLTQPTLRETVDALLARTGADAAVFDTSALAAVSTPVRALTVSQVSTVRAVLEQLAAAYFFEAYNADKLYFVPRGGASAATLPWDDLGAAEGETPDERLPLDVANDTEIAAQVSLTYANDDADYNTATEHSDRLLSDVISTATVQVPLALTAAEAKGIADAMVQDGYAGRLSGTLALDMRYAKWTPTDVVTLTDEDGSTYRVRIVRREQSGMVVRWEWVSDDANALASAGVTIDDYAPALTVSLPGPTSLALLDMPILRDADNAPGIYAVAKPVSTNASWPGARLMASSSGGDYTEAGTFTSRGIFGVTTVALTSWTGGHVFDEAGSVTVDVGAGTLSSSTRDAMLNTDANAMLVGAEIIQFRTATLVSTGIYKLTGLLRGRRGTEHAMTGHAVGETVALLRTAGMLRVGYDAARIGVEATYKAVTMGKTLSSASARSITDAGVALKPFAPVDLRAQRVDDGTIRFSWKRRTRMRTGFTGTAGSVVPLGESEERYTVSLYLNSGYTQLVRQITASTSIADYSIDMQAQDATSLVQTFYVQVVQQGVLPGYPLRSSVSLPEYTGPAFISSVGPRLVGEFDGALLALDFGALNGLPSNRMLTSADDGATWSVGFESPTVDVGMGTGTRQLDAALSTGRLTILENYAALIKTAIVAADNTSAPSSTSPSPLVGSDYILPYALGVDTAGARFLLVGLPDGDVGSTDPKLYESTNGTTWTLVGTMQDDPSDPNAIAAPTLGAWVADTFWPFFPINARPVLRLIGTRWFLAAQQAIFYTDDSTLLTGWRRCPTGLGEGSSPLPVLGQLVVLGSTLITCRLQTISGNAIAYSTDNGSTWTATRPAALGTSQITELYAHDGKVFAQTGTGGISTTNPASAWTAFSMVGVPYPPDEPRSFGANLVSTVLNTLGTRRVLMYSADGVTWQPSNMPD